MNKAKPYVLLSLGLLAVQATSVAATTGSISGTLKDPSGAVAPGVVLTATDPATGIETKSATDNKGFYSFPSLPVGHYDLKAVTTGFQNLERKGLAIDADSALRVDLTLILAGNSQDVTVSGASSDVHVESVSTQMGYVVTAYKVTEVALNGRSYTDLLSLQSGIVPMSTQTATSIVMAGASVAIAPSGGLNPGNQSISGQREDANGFVVNGGNVKELMNGGTSVIPNLDSIAEFRVLTNNVDAEYGNYGGGIVNVITKSGVNGLHGTAFEFLRNTDLDARNYFSPSRSFYRQNQFGGTTGGSIRKNKVFFFGGYQGTRSNQGVDTGLISVPTLAERSGTLSGIASQLTGDVSAPYIANLLRQKLGYSVSQGEPYYNRGCVLHSQCVFPNALIPQEAWSSPSRNLLKYIPIPNSGPSDFSTSAYGETTRDDKGSFRIDGTSDRWGMFTQLINMSHTKTFGATALNEFRLSYMRNANNVGQPAGGVGPSLASQGFVTGVGTPGLSR